MDGFIAAVCIVLLIALPVANKMGLFDKLIFKNQISETKYIATTPMKVETPESFETVMNALDTHVKYAPNKSSLNFVVYITSRNNDQVTYACGNKISFKVFEASVKLTRTGGKTVGIFNFLSYWHKHGNANRLDDMRALRNQVKKAFESVDSAKVSELI